MNHALSVLPILRYLFMFGTPNFQIQEISSIALLLRLCRKSLSGTNLPQYVYYICEAIITIMTVAML